MKLLHRSQSSSVESIEIASILLKKTTTARYNGTDEFWLFLPGGTTEGSNEYKLALDVTIKEIAINMAKVGQVWNYSAKLKISNYSKYYPSGNWYFDNEADDVEVVFWVTKTPRSIQEVMRVFRSRNVRRQLRKLCWL